MIIFINDERREIGDLLEVQVAEGDALALIAEEIPVELRLPGEGPQTLLTSRDEVRAYFDRIRDSMTETIARIPTGERIEVSRDGRFWLVDGDGRKEITREEADRIQAEWFSGPIYDREDR